MLTEEVFFQGVIAFLAMFCMDFAYAEWIKYVGDKKAIPSSVFAVVIMIFSYIVTTSYVMNAWMLIPVCFGAALGTYVSVKGYFDKAVSLIKPPVD